MKCGRSDAKTRDHPCNFEQRAQLAFCQVSGINEDDEVHIECKFPILFHCEETLSNYTMTNQYGSQITMDGEISVKKKNPSVFKITIFFNNVGVYGIDQ